MLKYEEIFGILIVFSITYVIIYLDHKMSNKCECKECISVSSVSFKVPIIMSILFLVGYKFIYQMIYSCFISPKQEVLTEMADF
jgi:hypothetical protein